MTRLSITEIIYGNGRKGYEVLDFTNNCESYESFKTKKEALDYVDKAKKRIKENKVVSKNVIYEEEIE